MTTIMTISFIVLLWATSFLAGWFLRRDVKEKPRIKDAFDDGYAKGIKHFINAFNKHK